MRKTINVKFARGSEVTLRTEDPLKRIVTGYIIRDAGLLYELACGEATTWHQEVEIQEYPKSVQIKGFAKNKNK